MAGKAIYVSNGQARGAGGKFVSLGKKRVVLKGLVYYEARPYMRPAMERTQDKLAGMFANSIG